MSFFPYGVKKQNATRLHFISKIIFPLRDPLALTLHKESKRICDSRLEIFFYYIFNFLKILFTLYVLSGLTISVYKWV